MVLTALRLIAFGQQNPVGPQCDLLVARVSFVLDCFHMLLLARRDAVDGPEACFLERVGCKATYLHSLASGMEFLHRGASPNLK